MAKNSKRKGKVGELELARKLREYGYDSRRTVQYNGKEEEGQADLLGLPGIHIECKRTEKLSLYDAVNQAKRDSEGCLLYTSPSPRDRSVSRMPSSA